MNKLKRYLALIISLCVLLSSSISINAYDYDNKNLNNNYKSSSNYSGVATLNLDPIGRGLVDADWRVLMSKGSLTNVKLYITINYGFAYWSSKTYTVNRKANWSKFENGSVQSKWTPGEKIKCKLSGTIEVNGQYDYPVSALNYGSVTVK